MSGFHVRYGWIARPALAALFPSSPLVERLAALVERRAAILRDPAMAAFDPARASRDLRRAVGWFQEPAVATAPARKTIKGARATLPPDAPPPLRAIVDWVGAAAEAVRATEAPEDAAHEELVVFLHALASTDFPRLLLWSQPALATRLFRRGPRGLRLADDFGRPDRRTTRAGQTCVAYALAGVGRLAPRDAWVGVGFGRFAAGARAEAIRVTRGAERVGVDPDLAWTIRHWTDLPRLPLRAGVRPWAYLAERIAAARPAAVGRRYRTLLARLTRLRDRLERGPGDFAAVARFRRAADALMRGTVGEQAWRDDPHGWWVLRHLPRERRVSPAVRARLLERVRAWRDALAAAGLLRPDEPGFRHHVRRPYPLRLKAAAPAAVLLEAEELVDWIVVEPGRPGGAAERPWVPRALPEGCGPVVAFDESGCRVGHLEPNPRRAAERFAAALAVRPRVCADPADRAFAALAPPPELADNRLVRLAERERARADVAAGDAVLFYSALAAPETAPLVELELASPRYAAAPDLVPAFFDPSESAGVTVGRVCAKHRVWLLDAGQARELADRARHAARLAALYYLEVHARLGAPTWVDVLLDGKRSALPTHSLLAWSHLLHLLRESEGPVALQNPARAPAPPLVLDAAGRALPAQAIIR